MSKEVKASAEGALAFQMGVPCEGNPYPLGRMAAAWLVGWCQMKSRTVEAQLTKVEAKIDEG